MDISGNNKLNEKKEHKSNKHGDLNKIKDKENKIKDIVYINKLLCLKIHILGNGDKKNYVINNIFKKDIVDEYLKNIAQKEFETEQFHWIARIYNDELITKEKCEEIMKNMKKDKTKKNKNILLKYQVILCFGNENTKILTENFIDLRKSRMIFITDTECDLDENIDKRYITNIISKNITNEQLSSKIISTLWELDCCFNEKGNQICRYTPEKIFNGLEKDNSLFSINILLTGLSRTGKSTFINLLSGKLMALEGDAVESVTKNISEYYIYKDDDKEEHGAIKIIDTPGIVPNNNIINNEYKDVEKKVINMIKEQDKSFENQIHFIFFVLNKGPSLEGENLEELFKALNESKCPVYFIINKVKKDSNINEIINPITDYLSENEFTNLDREDNFIIVNFKKDINEAGDIHGINTIFKKIYNHIKDKNYLNEELGNKMRNLLKDFRAKVEPHKLFISYEEENIISIDESKSSINYNERIKEINDLTKNNDLFSKIRIDLIIGNGRNIAKKCRDVIISLSNLTDILPNYEDIPILSIFQAFMVKEIGEGYGLDINVLNSGTKLLMNNMQNILSSIENQKIENEKDNNNKVSNILDTNEIIKSLDIIKNKVQDKLEKTNKDSILTLANLLNQIKELNKKKEKEIKELEIINQNFTDEVYNYCIQYFEKELLESKGLIFMVNYFNKCESLLEDIDYYIKKKDWGNYNIELKK